MKINEYGYYFRCIVYLERTYIKIAKAAVHEMVKRSHISAQNDTQKTSVKSISMNLTDGIFIMVCIKIIR